MRRYIRRNVTAAEFVLRFARLRGLSDKKLLGQFLARLFWNDDLLVLANALLIEKLEGQGFVAITEEDTEKGFLTRLIDWLSDPENRAKLEAIIKWFMELLDSLDP